MAIRQSERLRNIHSEALSEFNNIQSNSKDVRQQCYDDRRFNSVPGAQWEGRLSDLYENKPKLEFNKIHLSVLRIYNEYRNNRITVNFIPRDGSRDPLSDVVNGLFRADEKDSDAQEAYDNGFDEASTGGIGAWRLRAEYLDEFDEENEKQKIVFEPIYDSDTSVYFDSNAKKYDKSDAKNCYVLTSYTREAYEKEWGGNPTTWQKSISVDEFDWFPDDIVYVAEYYVVEEVSESIFVYKTLDGLEEKYTKEDFEENEDLFKTLDAVGTTFERERKIKSRKIHKYIMDGNSILEDCGYIAGHEIPIVPVYGQRCYIGNTERVMGHVRLAKDAQRLKNMQVSELAEISSRSPVEKPIFTPEQIVGHEYKWTNDNVDNNAYLTINPIKDASGNELASPPVGYTKVPNVPPAMAALLQLTDFDMKELLGSQEQGEKIVNNISGKAIELVQNRLDMQTYIYMSNMAKSMKRCGEIWLSMAKDLYVEQGRKMKTIGMQDEIGTVELQKPVTNERTGVIELSNDLSGADMGVFVTVGPSSNSKREATIRSLKDLMSVSTDPETIQVLTAMTMLNMEGEGIGEVRSYFRQKLIRMGVVKPNEEELQEMVEESQNVGLDPQSEYLNSLAEKELAEAAEARMNTLLTGAKVEETKSKTRQNNADTVKTFSEIRDEEVKNSIDRAIEALGNLNKETPGI